MVVPWRARTIVQRHGARRASRPQLKRDPLGALCAVPDGQVVAGSLIKSYIRAVHALNSRTNL